MVAPESDWNISQHLNPAPKIYNSVALSLLKYLLNVRSKVGVSKMTLDPRIADLEQRYIELLEKKVARLESEKDSKDKKPVSPVSQSHLVPELLSR